jgi:hypothetical protein
LKIPFLHFEIYNAYKEMFSVVSEVKSLLEKGRDFPPSSTEKIKRARKLRLRKYFQDRTRTSFPESEEGDIAFSDYLGPKKPIRFKDCIGRKFSFPFNSVATWAVRYSCSDVSFNCRFGLTICREWKS